MRGRLLFWCALLLSCLGSGCSLSRSVTGGPGDGASGTGDAFVRDGGLDASVDAAIPGMDGDRPDAYVEDGAIEDAFVPPDTFIPPDGFVLPDAFVFPDAFVPRDAWAPLCTIGATRCSADTTSLETCIAPGVWGPASSCGLGCVPTPSAHCGLLDASNVDETLYSGSADVTVGASSTLDTSSCGSSITIGGVALATTVAVVSGGPSVCVIALDTLTVTATLRVIGTYPLVLLASGDVIISGTVDASGIGTTPGAGGARSTSPPTTGRGGDGAQSTRSDGGGGGGGLSGAGGTGGVGGGDSGGSGGLATGGTAGSSIVSIDLRPLLGGSAGGVGGLGESRGLGGGGGGALQISSAGTITVNGDILVSGGGGRGGGDGTSGDVNIGAGGGGGSGGSILLEAANIIVTGYLGANGGGGGGAASCRTSGDGVSGQDGRLTQMTATGGNQGPTCGSDFGSNGGDASSRTSLAGVGGDTNTNSGGNGGGGGGGAGYIVVRSRGGTIATTNPSVMPGYRTLDILIR